MGQIEQRGVVGCCARVAFGLTVGLLTLSAAADDADWPMGESSGPRLQPRNMPIPREFMDDMMREQREEFVFDESPASWMFDVLLVVIFVLAAAGVLVGLGKHFRNRRDDVFEGGPVTTPTDRPTPVPRPVECRYCGTMFDAQQSHCPSCGAGRQKSQPHPAPMRHPNPKIWVDRDGNRRMDPDELE